MWFVSSGFKAPHTCQLISHDLGYQDGKHIFRTLHLGFDQMEFNEKHEAGLSTSAGVMWVAEAAKLSSHWFYCVK